MLGEGLSGSKGAEGGENATLRRRLQGEGVGGAARNVHNGGGVPTGPRHFDETTQFQFIRRQTQTYHIWRDQFEGVQSKSGL